MCELKARGMCNLIYAKIKCTDEFVHVNVYKCYVRPLVPT